MATFNDHLNALRRLIHDPNDVLCPLTTKTAAVNDAVKERDQVTGGNRTLIEYTLTAGQGVYTFTEVGNTRILDIVGIAVLWVGQRILMNQVSYTDLAAYYRTWNTFRSTPIAFARYGAASIRIGPLPAIAYATEWDVTQHTDELSGDTADPLPYPYTEPVPYYAAHLCMLNAQRYDEADEFLRMFTEKCNAVQGSRTGLLPTAYANPPR